MAVNAEKKSPPTDPAAKKSRQRSPNYPAIGLRKAVDQIGKFYETYKRSAVPLPVVHKHLGYAAGGSVAAQRIAALKAFGLIDIQGETAKSEVRISERAYRIVLNHADREGLLRAAALGPSLHKELWGKYGDEGLPPDDTLRHYLVFERSFNPDSVDGFIAQFKDTISFAKLDSSGKINEDLPPEDEEEHEMDGFEVTKNNQEKPPIIKSAPLGMTQDTFTIGGNVAMIRWPANLTEDQFQDLQDWIKLQLRRTARESGIKGQAN